MAGSQTRRCRCGRNRPTGARGLVSLVCSCQACSCLLAFHSPVRRCHAPPAPACPPALALACLSPAVVCPGCECAKLAVCLVPPTHRPACADISRDGPRPARRRALVGTATPAAANLHRSPLALPASSHHRPLRRQLVPSSPSLLRLSRLVAACWALHRPWSTPDCASPPVRTAAAAALCHHGTSLEQDHDGGP